MGLKDIIERLSKNWHQAREVRHCSKTGEYIGQHKIVDGVQEYCPFGPYNIKQRKLPMCEYLGNGVIFTADGLYLSCNRSYVLCKEAIKLRLSEDRKR